jgi:hypothetical protein
MEVAWMATKKNVDIQITNCQNVDIQITDCQNVNIQIVVGKK